MPFTPFTAEEYGDMILLYGEARCDAAEALRLYRERYPARRRPPGAHVISEAFQRIIENKPIVPELKDVQRNPTASSTRTPETLGGAKNGKSQVSDGGSSRPVKKKIRLFPAVSIEDGREGYCKWLVSNLKTNENFLRDILWTGERIFSNETALSGGNIGYWSKKPLTASQLARIKLPKKYAVRAWGAILDGKIYGPVFLPKNLNGVDYLNMINEHVVDIINELPVNRLNTVWFQHDGTPSHCIAPVCERLDELFPDKWIGRHGPVPWPSKSQDLTPMDFFLWERIKRHALSVPCDDNDEMRARLIRAFDSLRKECDNKPKLMKDMYMDTERRAHALVLVEEDSYFEEHDVKIEPYDED
ncbi:hypothetical protein EVAR_88047_1 [Eumeta japonica]|uniref:DUF4817 domain-containing protein n=1 Tax=Eumeta variegata TaxID=151549 RepID=A0A4C1VE07_EUMVA|nr:hypothetical protein EVAR_88047_1 [Eumeta japonica]